MRAGELLAPLGGGHLQERAPSMRQSGAPGDAGRPLLALSSLLSPVKAPSCCLTLRTAGQPLGNILEPPGGFEESGRRGLSNGGCATAGTSPGAKQGRSLGDGAAGAAGQGHGVQTGRAHESGRRRGWVHPRPNSRSLCEQRAWGGGRHPWLSWREEQEGFLEVVLSCSFGPGLASCLVQAGWGGSGPGSRGDKPGMSQPA